MIILLYDFFRQPRALVSRLDWFGAPLSKTTGLKGVSLWPWEEQLCYLALSFMEFLTETLKISLKAQLIVGQIYDYP